MLNKSAYIGMHTYTLGKVLIYQFHHDYIKNKYGKIKDFTIKEFIGLKPKMCSFLVDDSSEHKKAKGVNKNVVTTISHNEYKYVLLNNKCLRHSMNRI